MNSVIPTLCVALLLGAVAQSQIPGEDPGNSVHAPLNASATVPSVYRTTFGNGNNGWPLGHPSIRYQQVFLGSELPSQQRWVGLGLRQASGVSASKGQTIEIEIRLAYTRKTPSSLSTTFDSNFDIGLPAPVLVLPRSKFVLPDQMQSATGPQIWDVQIPFRSNFDWARSSGRNLLVEIRVFSNSNGNRTFSYQCDFATGSSVTTTRLYAQSVTAQTGVAQRNGGLVMSFLDEIRLPADTTTFGKGCLGSAESAGVVMPVSARTQMGNGSNYYGVGKANMRYQQVFDGKDMGPARLFTGHSLRMHGKDYAGGTQNLEVWATSTPYSPATITNDFNKNAPNSMTSVFWPKNYNYPKMSVNNDPAKFGIDFKWDKPWVWPAKPGEHLLLEIWNRSKSSLGYFTDAYRNDSGVSRVYATSAVNAATGTVGRSYGLVVRFNGPNAGRVDPKLSYGARPVRDTSFSTDLRAARPSTAAVLLLGFSKTTWGAIPLPFDLAPLGASGCSLLTSPDILLATATDLRGEASVMMPVSKDPRFEGLQWHNQWLVLDPGANGSGLVFSNGGTITVGGR